MMSDGKQGSKNIYINKISRINGGFLRLPSITHSVLVTFFKTFPSELKWLFVTQKSCSSIFTGFFRGLLFHIQ